MKALKRLAARLPLRWQHELKRVYYGRQIRRGTFSTTEPEFLILDELLARGDWVLDVGANVGHYTKRFSDLVGPSGRVVAVEPVPDTFAILAANASRFQFQNITLLNVAASDQTREVGIQIPDFDSGLKNYYEASVTTAGAELQVLAAAIDAMAIPNRVALVKIDAEGHDPIVIDGLRLILERDHPILIIETNSPEAIEKLARLGYTHERLTGSPNLLFRWRP